jgi:hypothetical protein
MDEYITNAIFNIIGTTYDVSLKYDAYMRSYIVRLRKDESYAQKIIEERDIVKAKEVNFDIFLTSIEGCIDKIKEMESQLKGDTHEKGYKRNCR